MNITMKDEDKSPNTQSDENHQASSQKFKQIPDLRFIDFLNDW